MTQWSESTSTTITPLMTYGGHPLVSTTVLPARNISVPAPETGHQTPAPVSRTNGRDDREAQLGSRMMYSRLIGALFLVGFVLYGVGNGLVTSVVSAPDLPSTISAHQATLLLGVFLMLLNSPAWWASAFCPFRSWRTTARGPRWPTSPRGLPRGFCWLSECSGF